MSKNARIEEPAKIVLTTDLWPLFIRFAADNNFDSRIYVLC